jgi:hypothetical protein
VRLPSSSGAELEGRGALELPTRDARAALIVSAAAPWSPKTHALLSADAKTRAVELLRIGWLLARHFQILVADTT